MLVICLTLVVILFLLLTVWIRSQLAFFARHKFLHKRPSFPLGNVHSKRHLIDIFCELYDEFKRQAPAFGMHIFISPAVVITDLSVIEDVLINNFDKFANRGLFHNKEDDPLSAHLVSLENEEWKGLRQKLIPFFSTQKMKMIFKTLMSVSEHMLESLKVDSRQQTVDVKDMFATYTTEVIGNVVYGIDMNALNNPNSTFRKMGSTLYEYKTYTVPKLICLLCFTDISRKFRFTLIPPDISKFFLGVVRATVKYRLANKIERKDALDILLRIEMGSKKGKRLSLEEIAAQCFVFFLYGFETVACTGAFVLYNLAMNAEIQERLRLEIATVILRSEGKITFEAIQDMKYLQMVIDETLRLFPPLFDIVRKSSSSFKIASSDLIIPSGTYVLIPIYSIHHDAEYYPDPKKFNPDRFSEENKAKLHPMAFIPFGAGYRNCIGARFGMTQLKIGLIQLLLNYRILPNENTPNPVIFDPQKPILTPLSAVWLTLERL